MKSVADIFFSTVKIAVYKTFSILYKVTIRIFYFAMRFNFEKKEMIIKIVFFGPSLGGKTTTLRAIYAQLGPENKGQFMSINTKDDRTLFFDFLPLELGDIKGFTRKWISKPQ